MKFLELNLQLIFLGSTEKWKEKINALTQRFLLWVIWMIYNSESQ